VVIARERRPANALTTCGREDAPTARAMATTAIRTGKVGYVDLASAAFTVLAADYLLAWRARNTTDDLARASVMLGCAMAVKMQGLFTVVVFMGAALWWALRLRRSAKPAIICAAAAFALAGPWYFKSWVITGNPVYPFAYGLFDGKHWSAEQAKHYAYHHAGFGYGTLPPEEQWHKLSLLKKRTAGPRNPLMLFLAPFTLTLFPECYAPRQPRLTAMVLLSIGPMYLALVPIAVAGIRRFTLQARWLAGLFAVFWIIWFETTQLVRYLLPWLLLLAPIAGAELAERMNSRNSAVSLAYRGLVAIWSAVALMFLSWQAMSPAPVALSLQNPRTFLMQGLDCYGALDYINNYTPITATIATYGEPRLFYLDRDYIWADPGHSQLIDYSSISTPDQLARRFEELGVEYVLVNQQFFGSIEDRSGPVHKLLAAGIEKAIFVPVHAFLDGKFVLLRVIGP